MGQSTDAQGGDDRYKISPVRVTRIQGVGLEFPSKKDALWKSPAYGLFNKDYQRRAIPGRERLVGKNVWHVGGGNKKGGVSTGPQRGNVVLVRKGGERLSVGKNSVSRKKVCAMRRLRDKGENKG